MLWPSQVMRPSLDLLVLLQNRQAQCCMRTALMMHCSSLASWPWPAECIHALQAQMSGMGDVPDISPEQLREASARMADMTPDDLARTADLAQAQQMRSGPAASANGNVSSTSAGSPLLTGLSQPAP